MTEIKKGVHEAKPSLRQTEGGFPPSYVRGWLAGNVPTGSGPKVSFASMRTSFRLLEGLL